MGRLTALGNFACFFSALSSAKNRHQAAAPCLDCCMADPVSTQQKPLHIETF
jgi:hypothetical protein